MQHVAEETFCPHTLSTGQTNSQSVASSRKLNLRRDFRWVAKRTRKYPRKYKKKHFKADISCISLADVRLMDVTQLALTWVGWSNGEKLASTDKFDLDKVSASHHMSTQVHARPGQTESQVDAS